MVTVRVRSIVGLVTAVILATAAVTVAVTSPSRVLALPGASESTVVTVEPTRVLDTRYNVGLTGAFQARESRQLTVTGSIETYFEPTETRTTKVVVPAGATGVLLNVTGVQPTGTGWIAVRPGDATGAPSTSSINLVPGDIVPNSVTVAVPTAGGNAGQIDITYGSTPGNTVNIIVDIVGYTTSTGLVDLVNRVVALESSGAGDLTALTARLDAAETKIAQSDIKIAELEAAQPFAVTDRDNGETVTDADVVVVSVTLTAPVDGQVTVNSTTNAYESTTGDDVRCSITTGLIHLDYLQRWESSGDRNKYSQIAGTRTFDLAANATATYRLVCDHDGASGTSTVLDSVLTAIFTPAP